MDNDHAEELLVRLTDIHHALETGEVPSGMNKHDLSLLETFRLMKISEYLKAIVPELDEISESGEAWSTVDLYAAARLIDGIVVERKGKSDDDKNMG